MLPPASGRWASALSDLTVVLDLNDHKLVHKPNGCLQVLVSDWIYDGFESFGAITSTVAALSAGLVVVIRGVTPSRPDAGDSDSRGKAKAAALEDEAGGGCGGDEGSREVGRLREEVRELQAKLARLPGPGPAVAASAALANYTPLRGTTTTGDAETLPEPWGGSH